MSRRRLILTLTVLAVAVAGWALVGGTGTSTPTTTARPGPAPTTPTPDAPTTHPTTTPGAAAVVPAEPARAVETDGQDGDDHPTGPTPPPDPRLQVDPDSYDTVPAEPDGAPLTDQVPPPTPQTPDQARRWAQATQAADRFTQALTTPAPDPATWRAPLLAQMSGQAAADNAAIDPARVPFTHATGPATPLGLDGPDDVVTPVQVPTDTGTLTLDVLDDPTRGPLISRLAFA